MKVRCMKEERERISTRIYKGNKRRIMSNYRIEIGVGKTESSI